ncbi:response regulator transcription factor [Paenibacillus sp. GYB003]|uniref:response regulator transcription factor n=1 Tax=Paenibacillus sp. GYB003 TaxID=2994392 RepID=UPI002F96B3F2
MYKVLLVDDERIILDGMAGIVDWAAAGTVLAGKARNGVEAYERIVRDPPDIVVSDIRMPGMDGLQLAARLHETHPAIKMIVLSGFGEFEYAQTAMQYGVKHYLLKPCNEGQIAEALREVVGELRQSERRERFVSGIRDQLEKVLPHVKEQFLKEFVTNKTYGGRDWQYYRNLFGFGFDRLQVRLLAFQLEGPFEFEHLFAVKNIAADLLPHALLSATVGDHVLIAVEDAMTESELHEKVGDIRGTFVKYYKIDLTIALSEAADITQARTLYNQTLECLNHRFYLGEGGLITKRDVARQEHVSAGDFDYNEDRLLLPIKTGHVDEAYREIDDYFRQIAGLRTDMQRVKSYVIQLFMAVIRLAPEEALGDYMKSIVALTDMNTLPAFQQFLKETAGRIALRHYEQNRSKHSAIVGKMKTVVEEHLGNPELSLSWVASRLLYMNADYLGKLFKKESGEKFSSYVVRCRIKKAVELLEASDNVKVFELAERLGFGDNPQYFSQVFKKHVGCAPSEYRKS